MESTYATPASASDARSKASVLQTRITGGDWGAFDFLGFTHICEINRKSGYFGVKRKTMGGGRLAEQVFQDEAAPGQRVSRVRRDSPR